ERLGGDRPKAFAPLRGRPLLAESLERLEASDWIDAIVVVAPEGWEEPSILVAEELGCGKVSATVTGGPSRAESVRLGAGEARGGRVTVVPGDHRLLKVTTPQDLALVESWLADEPS